MPWLHSELYLNPELLVVTLDGNLHVEFVNENDILFLDSASATTLFFPGISVAVNQLLLQRK